MKQITMVQRIGHVHIAVLGFIHVPGYPEAIACMLLLVYIIQQVNIWKGIVLMVFISSDYQLVMSPFLCFIKVC